VACGIGEFRSARGATLGNGGWLTLSMPGLSPDRIRHALRGALTSQITECQKLQSKAAQLLAFRVNLRCYGFYSRTPNAAAALTFSLCLLTVAKLIMIANIQQMIGPMIDTAEKIAMTHRINAATQLL